MYPFHVKAIVKTVVYADRDTRHEVFIKSYLDRYVYQNERPTLNGIIIA